jgi:hypothetical protein
MTWPAPERRDCLGVVEATTYEWGWTARCACSLDFAVYTSLGTARDVARVYADRCELAQRRLVQHRRRYPLKRPA